MRLKHSLWQQPATPPSQGAGPHGALSMGLKNPVTYTVNNHNQTRIVHQTLLSNHPPENKQTKQDIWNQGQSEAAQGEGGGQSQNTPSSCIISVKNELLYRYTASGQTPLSSLAHSNLITFPHPF